MTQNGKVADRVEGANAPELSNAVAKYAKTSTTAAPAKPDPVTQTTTPKVDLETRLKTLVNNAPVMIFIKGTPQQVGMLQDIEIQEAEFLLMFSVFTAAMRILAKVD